MQGQLNMNINLESNWQCHRDSWCAYSDCGEAAWIGIRSFSSGVFRTTLQHFSWIVVTSWQVLVRCRPEKCKVGWLGCGVRVNKRMMSSACLRFVSSWLSREWTPGYAINVGPGDAQLPSCNDLMILEMGVLFSYGDGYHLASRSQRWGEEWEGV